MDNCRREFLKFCGIIGVSTLVGMTSAWSMPKHLLERIWRIGNIKKIKEFEKYLL